MAYIPTGVSPAGGTLTKTLTFTGAAGAGQAASTITLFTCTGRVLINAIAIYCSTDLTEAAPTATMTCGTVTNISRFFSSPTGGVIALDAGEWWASGAAPVVGSLDILSGSAGTTDQSGVVISENIILTPATQNITGGVIDVYVIWEPLSAGATLVAA